MLVERISEGLPDEQRIKAILTTGAAVTSVAGAVPAGGTGAAAGGWDTAANRDTAITTITEIKTQLNALLTELRNRKIIGT